MTTERDIPAELGDPYAILDEIKEAGDLGHLPGARAAQVATVRAVLEAVKRRIRRRRRAQGLPDVMYR